jgi:hypothetical protein
VKLANDLTERPFNNSSLLARDGDSAYAVRAATAFIAFCSTDMPMGSAGGNRFVHIVAVDGCKARKSMNVYPSFLVFFDSDRSGRFGV